MPWNSDRSVESKKHGLDKWNKHKWRSIANASLKFCKDKGSIPKGMKSCEQYAIMTANSKTKRMNEGYLSESLIEYLLAEITEKDAEKMIEWTEKIIEVLEKKYREAKKNNDEESALEIKKQIERIKS